MASLKDKFTPEELFARTGNKNSPIFHRYVRQDLPYLQQFCLERGVRIIGADVTNEQGWYEPMYFFTDGLGGYTREAVMKTLCWTLMN